MSLLPSIHGIIDRRVLANYRAQPDVVARLLPAPFRPKLIRGHAIVGICLIRLREIRAGCVPRQFGLASENAAHRVAVEWEQEGQRREGVYVPRRDTSSKLTALAGGRLFSGPHHLARFDVKEDDASLDVAFHSEDDSVAVRVRVRMTFDLPAASVFRTIGEASQFFEGGAVGYSARPDSSQLDGIELQCAQWHVTPLEIDELRSSFFDDPRRFPSGSIEPDCALLMRGIEHEWRWREPMYCGETLTNA